MKYFCESMVKPIKSILLKHPRNVFISQENLNKSYEKYNYVKCPDYKKVLKEYESFEKIIKDNVENVFYLPKDNNTGLDSIYTHDTAKITKKGAIYFNMGKPLRRGEPNTTRKYLESLGIPTLGFIQGDGRMEGGDVVWLDEKTVAIGRGYRTNYEGIRQFKELVKDFIDEIIVVPLPHAEGKDECLHLMSLISMVDKDLAVVYSRYMPVFFREYLQKRGIKLLEVNEKEYEYLGSNVLALAPRKCLLIKGNPNIKEKLTKFKVKVYEYEGYDLSYLGTGGPTCLTMPLHRE
ncbi:MAG: amidinotransferase [Firmicutes bacterium]|nr:amidinotransferase [Bacillota bacterium]